MDEIIKNNLQFKYRGIPTRIDLVQYTNAMRLVFALTDYPMPSGATARIYVKKPSGKEVYNVATINGDTVTVSTTTQMTAEAGTNNAQLQIVKGSIVAASFVFCLHVQPNIAEDTAIESSNEYGVLDGLIADANNLIDQARATLGGITPINNLTSTDASKPLAAPMGKLLDDKISSLNADLMTVDFISQIQLLNGIEIAGYSEASYTGKTVNLQLHVKLPIDFPINAQTDIITLPPSFRTRAAHFPTVAQYTDEWRVSPSGVCYGYLSPSGKLKVSVPDKNTTWINISAIYFRKV